jgi:hypothetical protein
VEAKLHVRVSDTAVDSRADDYVQEVGPFITVLEFICGYVADMKRHGVPFPPKRKIAFGPDGLPQCEEAGQLYQLGDPSTAPQVTNGN